MGPNETLVDIEDEVTVYAKVGDFDGFKEADAVVNIQELSTYIDGKGKYRVRRNTDGNGTTFIASIKGKASGDTVKRNIDHPAVVNAGFFEAARIVADQLTVRDRYVFNGSAATVKVDGKEIMVPPFDFEVDVYMRHDGRESEWVKIDIEVNALTEALKSLGIAETDGVDLTIKVSHLPFKPQAAFISSDNNTPEEKEVIRRLWDEYAQSPYGGPKEQVESSTMPQQNQSNQEQPPVNKPSDNQRTTEGANDGESNV